MADPGNLGTILRVAEAAGAARVVLTAGSVDPFNPKVVRASAGALFHLPVVVDAALGPRRRSACRCWRTAATGGVPYDEAAARPAARPRARQRGPRAARGAGVDGLVSIPHVGRAESLNVAMAAAVLCFEVARRPPHAIRARR